jgi:hypothetical protein
LKSEGHKRANRSCRGDSFLLKGLIRRWTKPLPQVRRNLLVTLPKQIHLSQLSPVIFIRLKSGRKYAAASKTVLPLKEDPIKTQSARIFYKQWQLAKTDPEYVRLALHHRDQYEGSEPVAVKSPGSEQE